MKLIITGSRHITTLCPYWFRDTLRHLGLEPQNPELISEIISGNAAGIDRLGEQFASKYIIPLKKFPADWDTYGKAAGPIRNKQMAEYADALLLIWDGVSKGSSNMKQTMLSLNKPIYEVIIKEPAI